MADGPKAATVPVFTENDDRFHFDALTDQWWETETAWFSFHEPSRRLGGWFYTMVRPNIGTVAGGAWVWDEAAWLPWDVAYSANYSALPLPADSDLRDVALPTGFSIRVVKPTLAYQLGFEDGDRLRAELRFEGVMPPQPLTAVGSTFGSGRHYDQFGRVSGHLLLHGERIEIDCIAMRDRTWGPRPEHRPRRAAYVTGAAGPDHGFLAVTNPRPDHDPIAYGFLYRDGETHSLLNGERRVERDPNQGWITRVTIDAVDAVGRRLLAVGVPVSRMFVNRHTFIDINSLVRWDVGDETAWGEDQDMWPVHTFAAERAAHRRVAGQPPARDPRP